MHAACSRACGAAAPRLFRAWLLAVAASLADAGSTFCAKRFAGDCLGELRKYTWTSCAASELSSILGVGAIPAPVDFNGDGQLDLVVGSADGSLRYFERTGPDSLEEKVGAGANPFHGLVAGLSVTQPTFADWDGDGDLDLVVAASDASGARLVLYFERTGAASLAPAAGDANPFAGLGGLGVWSVAVGDWDGDGDLDVVASLESGEAVAYFERLPEGLDRRVGRSNPFNRTILAERAYLVVEDVDRDGDLDLLAGHEGESLSYYERLSPDILKRRDASTNPFADANMTKGFPAPAFGDWDGDGLRDLFLGSGGDKALEVHVLVKWHTLLERTTLEGNPFAAVQAGQDAAPAFANRSSGRRDLFVGSLAEAWRHYQVADSAEATLVDQGDDLPFAPFGLDFVGRPAFADWDGDGDDDALVADASGELRFFERLADGSLQRVQGEANPFRGIELECVPTLYDWDGDGDVDFIAGRADGRISYWERLADGSLLRRLGPDNPFIGIAPVEGGAAVAVGDIDGDGKVDVLVGAGDGTLHFYRRDPGGGLVRVGGIDDIFKGIDVGAKAIPALIDWDEDGDLELLVANGAGEFRFFYHGCDQPDPCGYRGMCNMIDGTCTCRTGYRGNDCQVCDMGYHTQGRKLHYPRRCDACAGTAAGTGRACADRGTCQDDDAARAESSASNTSSNTSVMLVTGDGSCTCRHASWHGTDDLGRTTCEEGECPAGTVERPMLGGPNHCVDCEAGTWSDPPGGHMTCTACAAGRFAAAGTGEPNCTPCPVGHYASRKSESCSPCLAGSTPTSTQESCTHCPMGSYSTAGSGQCIYCPLGLYAASEGNDECEFDWELWGAFAGCAALQFLAAFACALDCRRGIRVADVTPLGHKLAVTSLGSHGIRKRWASTAKVWMTETGQSKLDGKCFFARVLDPTRIELLSPVDMSPIVDDTLVASKGRFFLLPPRDVCVTGRFMPTALFSTLLTVVGLVFVVSLAASDFPEWRADPTGVVSLLWGALAAGCLVGVVVALLRRRRLASRPSPMQLRLAVCEQRIRELNPRPEATARGPERGVRVAVLGELLNTFRDFIADRNAYYLVPNIILPLTQPKKLSFAELVGPVRLNYFVSHYWGTSFADFVSTIKKHAEDTGVADWESLAYWICFLSNNQWQVADEVGAGDWQESSFYKALRSGYCTATCMVVDQKALPLTRSWCLFEVLQSYKLEAEGDGNGFQGLVFCSAAGIIGSGKCYDTDMALAKRLATLSVADATASNAEDQEMITRLVEEEGGMERMNRFIRDNMGRTLEAASSRFLEDVTKVRQGLAQQAETGSPENGTLPAKFAEVTL